MVVRYKSGDEICELCEEIWGAKSLAFICYDPMLTFNGDFKLITAEIMSYRKPSVTMVNQPA